jgi:hypothetical protein
MNGQRRPPLSTLLTAAAFGAVAGHSLTYLAAVPDPATRRVFLTATGHGYWPAAVPAALVLGVFAGLSTMIRHLGLDADGGRASGWSWRRVLPLLGLFQVLIFLGQETLERAIARAPFGTLFHDHVLLVGVLVQVVVAATVAIVLFLLARTAEIVAAVLTRGRIQSRTAASFPRPIVATLHPRLVEVAGSIRAPPVPSFLPLL